VRIGAADAIGDEIMQPTIIPRPSRQVRAVASREAELRQMAQALDVIAEHVGVMRQRLDDMLPDPARPGAANLASATDAEREVIRRVIERKSRTVEAVIEMLNRKAEARRRVIQIAHMR
jgi:microcompartment protein CcmL/EutN